MNIKHLLKGDPEFSCAAMPNLSTMKYNNII